MDGEGSIRGPWQRSATAGAPSPLATHLTLTAAGGDRPFLAGALAEAVFDVVGSHPATLAACLLPDHLHWVVDRATRERERETVERFRLFTAAVARRFGRDGPLWRPALWRRPVADHQALAALAAHLASIPVLAGLADEPHAYPYRMVSWAARRDPDPDAR